MILCPCCQSNHVVPLGNYVKSDKKVKSEYKCMDCLRNFYVVSELKR